MASCVLGARLSMKSDILKALYFNDNVVDDVTPALPPDTSIGYWDYSQDPDSGAIEKTWVTVVDDDPSTPDVDESTTTYFLKDQRCEIRGVMDGGIRVAGTTQRFSEMYENIEWLQATFDKGVSVAKGDKVTNIRNQKGVLLWRNEETEENTATTFNVMGTTPVLDPFGNLTGWKALLQRAEVQGG